MEHNLMTCLDGGKLDETLARLYGPAGLEVARGRVRRVLTGLRDTFGREAEGVFSAPGRTELGGNHTDHEHGHVLAAGVDLDILAAVAVNDSGIVRVMSEGYPLITVDLAVLTPQEDEVNTTAALIRGVAARMAELGCPLTGVGLDAYMISDVPGGSGLSSSAAFEVLMGKIFSCLFWDDSRTPVELAQIGQYAENVFFGKPCGLMDQTASSVGGVVAIDFQDPAAPVVEQVSVDLTQEGYALCIIDSGADHADLTGEYAAITQEMGAVCAVFGKKVLRDVPEEEFLARLTEVRATAGDRATVRAFHYYGDDRKAVEEAQALRRGDFQGFLDLIRASGVSSAMYLQNVIPTGQTREQALMFTIALAERLLAGRGAVRVHGGGFAGTAQAFVPLDMLSAFVAGMEGALGAGSCHVLTIRPVGGARLA